MTAVEFLINRISVLIPEDIGSQLMFKSNVEKAKQMEAEQQEKIALEFAEIVAWNIVGKTITESLVRNISKKLWNEFLKTK